MATEGTNYLEGLPPWSLDASLLNLHQYAYAFPPLKSACYVVLAIWATTNLKTDHREDTSALAQQCYGILDVVADSVADLSAPSTAMMDSLLRFIG
ncbi:hypothetical protein DXG01_012056 [Tephrocybe rancida]|nr:hypothetical protein DXG01_012056 [Tephrocybe rancida]